MKERVMIIDDKKELLREFYKIADLSAACEFQNYVHLDQGCIMELDKNTTDILILNFILPQQQELRLLEQLAAQKPQLRYIICAMDGFQDMIFHLFDDYPIIYLMVQKEHMKEAVQKVSAIMRQLVHTEKKPSLTLPHDSSMDLVKEVTAQLHTLGIPSSLKGYLYLRKAILAVHEHSEWLHQMTKTLYPYIANHYDTTPSKVERSIRHAIEVAWSRGNIDLLNDIFGYTVSAQRSKPTNSEFIAMLADRLYLEQA